MARRSGYSAQKRRRELAKQKKRAAKQKRRANRTEEDQETLIAGYLGQEIPEEESGDEEASDEDQ